MLSQTRMGLAQLTEIGGAIKLPRRRRCLHRRSEITCRSRGDRLEMAGSRKIIFSFGHRDFTLQGVQIRRPVRALIHDKLGAPHSHHGRTGSEIKRNLSRRRMSHVEMSRSLIQLRVRYSSWDFPEYNPKPKGPCPSSPSALIRP